MDTGANPAGQGDHASADATQGGDGSPTCTSCSRLITDRYHEANGAIVCSMCRAKIEAELNSGSGAGRFVRALGFGFAGAIAGALLYFAVLKLTGYEIGLIAIVVGFLVGRGVQMGARGRGGWKYQTLAVALTYSAIVVTYVPFIVEELHRNPGELSALVGDSLATGVGGTGTPDLASAADVAALPGDTTVVAAEATQAPLWTIPIALLVLFVMAAAMPVLAGVENIIGLAIIGFALYQAWSMNKRVVVNFTGPYRVGPAPATEGPAAA